LKFFIYIRYFFFLANKWDISFAWKSILDDRRGERKYGIDSTGFDDLRHVAGKGIDISHATLYMPAPYRLLENIFNYLQPFSLHHFLDIGAGKGRALCMAPSFGFQAVEGVEFSKKFCMEAEANLARCNRKKTFDWKIHHNDAYYFDIPAKADCILIFNPFDEFLLAGVIQNIENSLQQNPRRLYIIYITPLYKDLFFESGYDVIARFIPEEYMEAIVLKKSG